ncbi:MAG: DUF1833 family protein [Vibrio splendidus]
MQNEISVQTIIEKNKIASSVPFLIFLEIDVVDRTNNNVVETLRVVKNSEDVRYRGDLYAALDFDISFKSEEGEQASVTLNIRDYQRSVQARAQAYGGGVGSIIRLMVVNTAMLDKDPDVLETFTVTKASAKSFSISWTLGSVDFLTLRTPKRKQMRNRCSWRYKSKDCGYKGPIPACDLSLQGPNGCSFHRNSGNFGGFPGIGH